MARYWNREGRTSAFDKVIGYNSEDLLVTNLQAIKAARETKLSYHIRIISYISIIHYQFQNTFGLYPIASVTNYHLLASINTNLFSYSFIGQKSEMDPQGYIPSGGSSGKSVYLPFLASTGCPHSLTHRSSFLSLKWEMLVWDLSTLWSLVLSSASLSTYKDPRDYSGLTWLIQDPLPISRSPD